MFVRVMPQLPTPRVTALIVGTLAFALLVRSWDAPRALIPLIALCALVPLLLWPQLAIFATLFLLYTNIPAVAHQLYDVPQLI
ncbi:MAG TPA: hypothetical protein VK864_01925, partial [Longimicrobiales bacterium]|nr:hypothetical protein [Longimicrobiales bacterium]